MATEKNLKKLTIHKLKKKTYNALAEKPVDELVMLTDVGGQVAEITEASADYVGEIVQYVGGTNDTYTNGFFYKCVETDGAYSWTQVNVQEGGGTSLPDQTSNAGKFLTTDGTTTSWGGALVNSGSNGFGISPTGKRLLVGSGGVAIGDDNTSATGFGAVSVGRKAITNGNYTTAIGGFAEVPSYSGNGGIALGAYAKNKGQHTLHINTGGETRISTTTEVDAIVWGNSQNDYVLFTQDGTIPTDRYTTTPTTAGTYVPKLTIAEDGTATRKWGTESGGAGGDSLPDQTDNAGKFLMTNGESTSWGGADLIKNTAPELYRSSTVRIGLPAVNTDVASSYISITGSTGDYTSGCIVIGSAAKATGANSIAIGRYAQTTGVRSVILDASGSVSNKNTEADVFAVANGNGLFVMMDANGNVPRERLKNLVEVLPTAENGYTTVKNFGNNYIEATGVYEVGSVEANAEMVDVIAFPEGVQFEEGQLYWANAHATTEDSNANAVVAHITSRGPTGLTIVYKNLGATEVENLIICWEVRGVVAPK